MKCTSCSKEVTDNYIRFKCPGCKRETIRCHSCRTLGTRYTCGECGFEGP